jgi:hypothetical protein|tara:strand:+ start:2036 stop:2422 length:387 start_codon:yes stop_codon:yes gene_type:complete
MLHLNIFWAWTKKNWKLSALAVWSIFIWLVSRKNADGAIQAMKANKESYEAQIQGLKDAHEEEIQKREELHLKYQATLGKIEEKYNLKEEDFSREKKKKIKEIVKKAKDNPDEINEKIENLFGFTAAD